MKPELKKYIFIAVDIVIALFSVFAAIVLRFELSMPSETVAYWISYAPIAVVTTIGFSLLLDSYSNILAYFGFTEMIRQGLVVFFVACVSLALKYTAIHEMSGSIIVLYAIVFFLISSFIRGMPRYKRWFVSLNAGKFGNNKKVLIVGAGYTGAMLAKRFIDNKQDGYYPIGFLDDDVSKHGMKIVGTKVLGEIDTIAYYSKKMDADEILIAISSANDNALSDIYDKVSNANLPIKVYQKVINGEMLGQNDKQDIKDVSIEDLLFRDPIDVSNELNRYFVQKKVVLVTGGAGSIGSELCRQILANGCKQLIIFDIHENGLYEINEEFKNVYNGKYVTCLGSVRDRERLADVFETYKPQLVFHAAAHKHVPMMEINPFEAVKNNVFGTLKVLEQAKAHAVKKFILISTDKAVNPTNIMGATKRICELLVKSHSDEKTECVAVRFGNVLGSNGSVIPLFKKQIEKGGPVTVTHKEMTRYFMTIKEAVSLVLSAGAYANGAELFVLDMGKPVKIYDLAINLIRLSGKIPFKDVNIVITGLRDGEKMFEELRLDDEVVEKTANNKIFVMKDNGVEEVVLKNYLDTLTQLIEEQNDEEQLREVVFDMITMKSNII